MLEERVSAGSLGRFVVGASCQVLNCLVRTTRLVERNNQAFIDLLCQSIQEAESTAGYHYISLHGKALQRSANKVYMGKVLFFWPFFVCFFLFPFFLFLNEEC